MTQCFCVGEEENGGGGVRFIVRHTSHAQAAHTQAHAMLMPGTTEKALGKIQKVRKQSGGKEPSNPTDELRSAHCSERLFVGIAVAVHGFVAVREGRCYGSAHVLAGMYVAGGTNT
jgi:hypothetical protein